MDSKEYIAHIGFPKCASSTLQTELFNLDKNAEFLSPSHLENVTGREFIQNKGQNTLLHERILKFIEKKDLVNISEKNTLKRELKSKKYAPKTRTIFSSEWITGCRYMKNSFNERIKLFSDIFPEDTKIILVVRNHFDLILSLYRDNQKSFDGKTFYNIDEFFNMILSKQYINRITYEKIYKTLIKYFKPENIYIYQLKSNINENIIEDINRDFGFIDQNNITKNLKNIGVSTYQFYYLKFIRRMKFIKILIPKILYLNINRIIMYFLRSNESKKFKNTTRLKENVSEKLSNDWDYISKKLRNY